MVDFAKTENSKKTYSDYKDVFDKRVIAKILGVKQCPVDKLGTPLVNIRRQRVHKVLPHEYFGVIFTPRLEICDENGVALKLGKNYRGVDDMTYKTYPEIQRVVPRCYSIFLVFRRDTEALVTRRVMHGYYKFGGKARDEDSGVSTSGLFKQAPLFETERVVITEKANGKAAVMSMFRFEGKVYFFGGSKGDHYVTLAENGMEHLQRLNRNLFAFYIFDVFFKIWDSLSKSSQEELIECLAGSSPDDLGYTLCAEYEDGRHMVPLPLDEKGNMVNDNLRMFGLVKNQGAIKKGITLCEDVSKTLSWFRSIGLSYTPFYIKEINEFNAIKERLREGTLKEGYVLHYQKANAAGEYVTIAVEKHKVWWYIVLRLLREYMRNEKSLKQRTWRPRLLNRLKNRNESYMKMPPRMFERWCELVCKFVQWFFKNKYTDYLQLIGFESGSLGMGTMWREFLFDFPGIDDSFGFKKDPIAFASYQYRKGLLKARSNTADVKPSLVVFQGIPGLGKSTLSAYLRNKTASDGIASVSLEQDAFVEKYGVHESSRVCLNALKELIKSHKYKIIFLMRNNSELNQFRKYARVAKSNNWNVHVFAPKTILESLHLALVCVQSVYIRGEREEHPTFKNYSPAVQLKLAFAFLAKFKRAEKSELVDSVNVMSWIRPEAVENKMDVVLTKRTANFFRACLEHYRSAEDAFTAEPIDAEDVISGLMLETNDYQTWRHSPERVTMEVAGKLYKVMKDFGLKKTDFQKAPMITDDMLYIALSLDTNSQEILCSLIKYYDFDMADLVIQKMDHLTMIYENKNDPAGSRIWQELIPQARQNKQLGVVVQGIAYWPKNIICFAVQVRSEVGANKGESLLRLVFSRHPHITAVVAKNVLPVESVKLLKYLAKEEAGEGRFYIPLKRTVVLAGTVTITYKSGFVRI